MTDIIDIGKIIIVYLIGAFFHPVAGFQFSEPGFLGNEHLPVFIEILPILQNFIFQGVGCSKEKGIVFSANGRLLP